MQAAQCFEARRIVERVEQVAKPGTIAAQVELPPEHRTLT